MLAGAVKVAPLAGEVNVAVGIWFAGAVTVTVAVADDPVAPASSTAVALRA